MYSNYIIISAFYIKIFDSLTLFIFSFFIIYEKNNTFYIYNIKVGKL